MVQYPEHNLAPGTRIGVYEILQVVHSDSIAITYLALNEHLNTEVQLQEYFPRGYAVRAPDGGKVKAHPDKDPAIYDYGLTNFLNLAETLNEINHPNIVSVLNVVNFNGTAYIAMDKVRGTVLKSKKVKDLDKRVVIESLLSALEVLHAKGAVHGDINPQAIFLDKHGSPVLMNFSAPRLALAQYNGTLAEELRDGYTAAELYDNKHNANAASDIYSLAASMYRFITQKEPKSASSRLQAQKRSAHDPLPAIYSLAGPSVDKDLLTAINSMLAPDVKSRPKSVTEVLALLQEPEEGKAAGQEDKRQARQVKVAEKTQQSPMSWAIGLLVVIILFGLGFLMISQKAPEKIADDVEPQVAEPVISEPVQLTQKNTQQTGQSVPANDPEPIVEPKEKPISATNSESSQQLVSEQPAKLMDEPPETQVQTTENQIDQANAAHVDLKQVATQTQLQASEEQTVKPEAISQAQDMQAEPEQTAPVLNGVVEDNNFEIQEQEQIASHLQDAQQNISRFQLTTPESSNAYQELQAIKRIDPQHPEIDKNIEEIVDKYILLIYKAIKEQKLTRARIYLQRALKVAPDDAELLKLQQKLS